MCGKPVSYTHLITGNIGRENAGINPLRGQNNVQGACDMGCLPSDLPGYQKVNKPEVIEKFEKVWERPLSPKVGLTPVSYTHLDVYKRQQLHHTLRHDL